MDALWSDILEILWRNPGDILKKMPFRASPIGSGGSQEILVIRPRDPALSAPFFQTSRWIIWLLMVPQIGGIGDI